MKFVYGCSFQYVDVTVHLNWVNSIANIYFYELVVGGTIDPFTEYYEDCKRIWG